MTVIIKVNPVQIRPFQGFYKLRVGRRRTKKLMLVLEKWNLEIGFKNARKILKLSTSSIKFYLRPQLLSEFLKLPTFSNIKQL